MKRQSIKNAIYRFYFEVISIIIERAPTIEPRGGGSENGEQGKDGHARRGKYF